MLGKKRYRLNTETLNCEVHKTPFSTHFLKGLFVILSSVGVFFLALYIFTQMVGLELPKTKILEKNLAEWHAKLDLLNKKLEKSEVLLNELQMRDNILYRPVFGMEEIPQDVRNAGFGGVNRYSHLERIDQSGLLTSTAKNLDILYKKAYIQSRSLDDVSLFAKRTGEMALCMPTIPPVTPTGRIRISSGYGMRLDPGDRRYYRMHHGVDLSGPKGEPIFVTGNGVVESVGYDFFGYGNYVLVNHGFGYKTRYAHLRSYSVTQGQKISRGDQVGEMGDTGRSFGTHLHYEVIYKNATVNPINYLNLDISTEDYSTMVKPLPKPLTKLKRK